MKARCSMLFTAIIAVIVISCQGCSSSTGNSKPDETPPPTPTALTIDEIGNGSVTLSWNPVSDKGLKGYYVYWLGGSSVDTANANRRFVMTANETISGLDYDTLYYFAVSSVDVSDNESGLSVQVGGKPQNTTIPYPPDNIDLVAENIDYPKITIYWSQNDEPDLSHYNLYRAESSASLSDSSSFLVTLSDESYEDIEVEIGNNYYYRVTAVDKEGWESAPSETVNDYVLPKVTLVSPLKFSYTGVNPTLEWEPVPGVKKYNVVVSTSRIGGEIWNTEVDETTTRIVYQGKTKLISGNTYYWRVGSISRKEINSISDIGSFVVQNQ